ncbi:MAG: homocysteine S-methyltransferase family protein [Deltaproteobacteria bacterium]|nr:MAG: homocysteine S-methyltransferase family protein [Deltaproteobacteria bacterium]
MPIILLDGPLGTELNARGVDTRLPEWSAGALREAPAVVQGIHADYAAAGAVVHTTNTFRTRQRQVGDAWESLARRAVDLVRAGVEGGPGGTGGARVAGSVAPLEDCYRPDLSPRDPGPEHRALVRVLADAGVDLLLCETFPNPREALIAAEEALATGLPTWVALTAGPSADLMTPKEMGETARELAALGAAAVLVNCVPASATRPYLDAIAEAGLPFGAYANAGRPDEEIGWQTDDPLGPARYAELAAQWATAGATIIGGCCGTGPRHVAALAELLA